MSSMTRVLAVIGALALAAAAGWTAAKWHATWQPDPMMDHSAVAVIGEVPITEKDFITAMQRHGGLRPGQFQTVEQRRELLDAMIEQQLLINAARDLGLENDPEVARLSGKILVDRYQSAVLKPLLEEVSVSSTLLN